MILYDCENNSLLSNKKIVIFLMTDLELYRTYGLNLSVYCYEDCLIYVGFTFVELQNVIYS